jgi:aryl-alcohol dehydrogenase-like predicted oxidoreductase
MQRRDFVKGAVAGTLSASSVLAANDTMPRRTYKPGIRLSIIGFGGILVVGEEQSAANKLVAEAVDRGINYFDVAPSYGVDGEAEKKLGIALAPYRKNAFLACKTEARDVKGIEAQLENTLRRLKTDHVDLYQFHAVHSVEEVDKIIAPNGPADLFYRLKKEGKAAHIGFSAHDTNAALKLMDNMELDSVLFPVNYVDYSQSKFGPAILTKAKEKGLARLALKALAKTTWKPGESKTYPKCWYRPIEDPTLAEKALRFTLSEDITAAIPPGDSRIYQIALAYGPKFRPLSGAERTELLASAEGIQPIFPQSARA